MVPRPALAVIVLVALSGCASPEKAKPSNWRLDYWTWARTRHPDWPQETWDKIQGERSQGLAPAEREVQNVGYSSSSLESAKRELVKREEISSSRERAWADARRNHPEWPDSEFQSMQAGEIWAGMTEEQFLLTMMELNPRTKWHISDSDDFRIYIDDATNDNFTFNQKTKKLKLWRITPR